MSLRSILLTLTGLVAAFFMFFRTHSPIGYALWFIFWIVVGIPILYGVSRFDSLLHSIKWGREIGDFFKPISRPPADELISQPRPAPSNNRRKDRKRVGR